MALPTLKITDTDGNNYLGVGFVGDSAYDIAVKNGFEGTQEEWLQSLKSTIPGPKGEDGTMKFEELTEEQRESLRGPQGNPGISPTVTTSAIVGGTAVTITDATGAHTFNVMDGAKGDEGEDYVLTDSDISAIADIVFSKIPNASEVRY